MSIKLPTARKKRKTKVKLENLLPIPLASDSDGHCSLDWTLYTGHFKYGTVIVQKKNHAKLLWENGFFGDGSLSSWGLNYNTRSSKMEFWQIRRIGEWRRNGKDFNHLSEALNLCLEEAMFLSYALGTLVLSNDTGMEMDIDDMWSSFCATNTAFPLQYSVYHHFRTKGWIVKPGLKFGADWMLYPVGPPFYHSQYLVWVQCLWEETLEEDTSLSSRKTHITDLSAIERLSGHIGKGVLLCQVLRPTDLTDECLKSIDCLQKFVISETILQRWTSPSEEVDPEDPAPSGKNLKHQTSS